MVMAWVLPVACIPRPMDPTVTGPEPPGDLAAAVTPASAEILEGVPVVLTATASGGSPPYLFRWDQNAGPATIALESVQMPRLALPPLTAAGRYVFRVIVTDSADHHATAFVAVSVAPAASTVVPTLAVVGEPLQISVEVASDEVTPRWQVAAGAAAILDENALETTLTALEAGTIQLRLTLDLAQDGGSPITMSREFEIAAMDDLRPRVRVETNFGGFTLELDAERAPETVANFLLHVDAGFFEGLLFHRNACRRVADGGCVPFVLQGGGFERVADELIRRDPPRDPVPSEAGNGLTNGLRYSVAMALRGSDRNSAQTQFFINLSDENDFLDEQGFTVFAQVVEGTEVIDALADIPTVANPVIPNETSLPETDIVIEAVRRL